MPSLVEIRLVVLEKKIIKFRQYIFGYFKSLVEIGRVVQENFVNVFLLIPNYLSLEKSIDLHMNKFESPSAKDALC